jgi:hypothetical protein
MPPSPQKFARAAAARRSSLDSAVTEQVRKRTICLIIAAGCGGIWLALFMLLPRWPILTLYVVVGLFAGAGKAIASGLGRAIGATIFVIITGLPWIPWCRKKSRRVMGMFVPLTGMIVAAGTIVTYPYIQSLASRVEFQPEEIEASEIHVGVPGTHFVPALARIGPLDSARPSPNHMDSNKKDEVSDTLAGLTCDFVVPSDQWPAAQKAILSSRFWALPPQMEIEPTLGHDWAQLVVRTSHGSRAVNGLRSGGRNSERFSEAMDELLRATGVPQDWWRDSKHCHPAMQEQGESLD